MDNSAVNVNVTVDDFDSVLSYPKQSDWQTPDPSSADFKDGDASPWWMGTYHETSVAGASVSFNFTGPAVYIYGHAGPSYGSYNVTIDSQTETKSASQSTNASTPFLLYGNNNLSYGFHKLTLTNVGAQGQDSGQLLLFDYIQTTVQLAPPGATIQNVTYEEDNPALRYSGTWDSNKSSNFSGGGTSYTHEDKAAVSLSFNGSAVYVFGDKKNDHGNYSVVLDGRPAEIYWGISGCGGAYGLTCEQQKPTLEYFASNLNQSEHTLRIANIGGVNNSFFDLDSIVVTVPSTFAPRLLDPDPFGAAPTTSTSGPTTTTSSSTTSSNNPNSALTVTGNPLFPLLFGLFWLLRLVRVF